MRPAVPDVSAHDLLPGERPHAPRPQPYDPLPPNPTHVVHTCDGTVVSACASPGPPRAPGEGEHVTCMACFWAVVLVGPVCPDCGVAR